MQYCNLNRTEFASLMSEAKKDQPIPALLRRGRPEHPPSSSEVWVAWADEFPKGDTLPTLVVVADEDLTNFLAWAVTFLPGFRPLTSFLRVLPWTVFWLAKEKSLALDSHIQPLLAGAILGETLMNGTSRGFIESLPLTAFESTYSHVMSRTIASGLNFRILPYVSNGWHQARELTAQKVRRMPPDSLESIWSVILRLMDYRQSVSDHINEKVLTLIEEACREIQDRGTLSSFNWHRLSDGRINNSAIADSMKSTKERRVEVFETAVRNLSRQVSDELSTSFLVGYLASLVSDGSLEHAQLILPLQGELPTAMVWYGVCSGLFPNSRVLTDYGHLGLRILRSIRRNEELMSAPNCDISLSELEVLLRGEPRSRLFRQMHASFLRVELAPMVTTVVRSVGATLGSDQLGLFTEEERGRSFEIERLRELVGTLRGSLSLAESLLGVESRPSSGSNFQTRKRRR